MFFIYTHIYILKEFGLHFKDVLFYLKILMTKYKLPYIYYIISIHKNPLSILVKRFSQNIIEL